MARRANLEGVFSSDVFSLGELQVLLCQPSLKKANLDLYNFGSRGGSFRFYVNAWFSVSKDDPLSGELKSWQSRAEKTKRSIRLLPKIQPKPSDCNRVRSSPDFLEWIFFESVQGKLWEANITIINCGSKLEIALLSKVSTLAKGDPPIPPPDPKEDDLSDGEAEVIAPNTAETSPTPSADIAEAGSPQTVEEILTDIGDMLTAPEETVAVVASDWEDEVFESPKPEEVALEAEILPAPEVPLAIEEIQPADQDLLAVSLGSSDASIPDLSFDKEFLSDEALESDSSSAEVGPAKVSCVPSDVEKFARVLVATMTNALGQPIPTSDFVEYGPKAVIPALGIHRFPTRPVALAMDNSDLEFLQRKLRSIEKPRFGELLARVNEVLSETIEGSFPEVVSRTFDDIHKIWGEGEVVYQLRLRIDREEVNLFFLFCDPAMQESKEENTESVPSQPVAEMVAALEEKPLPTIPAIPPIINREPDLNPNPPQVKSDAGMLEDPLRQVLRRILELFNDKMKESGGFYLTTKRNTSLSPHTLESLERMEYYRFLMKGSQQLPSGWFFIAVKNVNRLVELGAFASCASFKSLLWEIIRRMNSGNTLNSDEPKLPLKGYHVALVSALKPESIEIELFLTKL